MSASDPMVLVYSVVHDGQCFKIDGWIEPYSRSVIDVFFRALDCPGLRLWVCRPLSCAVERIGRQSPNVWYLDVMTRDKGRIVKEMSFPVAKTDVVACLHEAGVSDSQIVWLRFGRYEDLAADSAMSAGYVEARASAGYMSAGGDSE